MARFSAAEAAVSGFGVIARAPVAVLVWGAVMLVTVFLPVLGLMAAMAPQLIELFANMPPPGASADDAEVMARMMRLQSSMMGFNALSFLGGAVIKGVIGAAVFRAVLEPDNKRWFYLRLGSQELWVALVTLVQGVLFMMAYFIVLLVVALVCVILVLICKAIGGDAGMAVGILLSVLLGLAALGAFVWAALRLSMAAPMSFAQNKFLLFESWPFTRGQVGRLVGMCLLLLVLLLLAEMVVYAVVGIGAFLTWDSLTALAERLKTLPPQAWAGVLWPIATLGVVVLSFLGAAAMALFYAPWAKAYQELTASGVSQETPASV
ncbi:MAG: hypothetical protein J7521_16305 [Caulobacter sp.]|nr:hypothetical protein [Caulobacter sp.]